MCCSAPLASVLAQSSESASRKPATAVAIADPMLIDGAAYNRIVARYHGKPLLVTFWATWCRPCRDEYPMMVELAKKYAGQGLAVFGVSMGDDSDMNLVRHFLAQNQPIFPNYRQKPGIDVDDFYHGVNPNWMGGMPETILLRARRTNRHAFCRRADACDLRESHSDDPREARYRQRSTQLRRTPVIEKLLLIHTVRRRFVMFQSQGDKFTWLGHAAFHITTPSGKIIFVDPWILSNPMCPEALKKFERIDMMLISHGHFDHIADAVELGKK